MNYFGDGDSKAYASTPYYKPDIVKKFECVGHLSEAPRDEITQIEKNDDRFETIDVLIDKLQNYFGMALRANTCGTAKKKGRMLSGQVSSMSLVTNNNIIICYANSHQRAVANTRGLNLIKRTYSNMDRVCRKK